jgi:phage N-6-adenine-methyltransferase
LLASLVEQSPERATQVQAALHGAAPADELRAILTAARCGICHRPLSDPASVSRGIGPICTGHGSGGSHSAGILSGAAGLERFTQELERIYTGHDADSLTSAQSAPVLVLEPEDPEADEMTAPATGMAAVSSGDFEWYTPPAVLDRVRAVLGTIDVDLASCAAAQANVQAQTFYTLADDGLRQPWHGTVFCNPPYKMPEIARFIGKLCEELDAQRTTAAIVLVNAATETDWFQTAFARADAVCFPDGRIHFVSTTRNGNHPFQGQALLYYGPHVERFCVVFAALGVSTRVHATDAQQAQLALARVPTFPDDPAGLLMGRDGRPMRARDYCIVHLKQRHADFDHCSVQACSQAPHYLFWAQTPRQDGDPTWTRYYELCPAHAREWCTAHQVDIRAIPTISLAAWGRVWLASPDAYDQLPWFRLAAPGASSAPTPTPTRLRDQVGLQQAVWLTVQQLAPCTNAQVKEALGEQRPVTHQALRALVKQGKVTREGQTYRVVDAAAPGEKATHGE